MENKIVITIIVFFAFSCISFAEASEAPGQEMSDFSLVQYEDGSERKWELNGASAEIEDNNVKIGRISALAFEKDSAVKLKAKSGNFDRDENVVHLEKDVVLKTTDGTALKTDFLDWNAKSRDVFTDALVNISRSDFQVIGTGAVCDLEDKTARLKKDVTANIRSSGLDSFESGTSQPLDFRRDMLTTITCDGPLELDYGRNKATFLNNVIVENLDGNISAERIDVYFYPETWCVKYVVASGNVNIANGGSVTYSEEAVYWVDEGRLVLPNKPKLVLQAK